MRRVMETPARGRSMVSMIKTLGERLSSQADKLPVVENGPVERPQPPQGKHLQRR